MTGYQSKKKVAQAIDEVNWADHEPDGRRAAAQDKLVQWANEAFNDWWDSDYDDSTNPYEINTFAYWAWAGWTAALAQPEQEPTGWVLRSESAAVKTLENLGYIYQGGALWKPPLGKPPQRTWVGLTDEEIKPCWHEACQTDLELTSQLVVYFAKAIETKLKEKNT